MKGIIIGGGIAGLTAAVALQKAGISTEIYESAPELQPAGAGIWMASNAMQALDRLGLADAVQAAGASHTLGWIGNGKLGLIGKMDLAMLQQRFGFGGTAIHRASLQEILLAQTAPGSFFLGKRLQRFEQDEAGVEAFFSDGSSAKGDFLLGADGIHSAVRRQLYPEHPYRQTGQVCWRGVCEMELPEPFNKGMGEAWGGKVRLGILPIGQGKVYWFAVEKRPPFAQALPAWKAYVQEKFQGFGPMAQQMLQATPENKIIYTEIYDFDHLPRWSEGRVLLIGDAGHATTPNMGQGGCQAVEDAYALGELFRLRNGQPIEAIFTEMERLRRPRVQKVVDRSFRFGKMAHWQRGKGLRNLLLRLTPPKMLVKQMDWLYDLPDYASLLSSRGG